MTAYLRLLRIESRRSVGLWLFLPMLGLAWYMGWSVTQNSELAFWEQTSVSIKNSVLLIGPLFTGLAAWVAGRNRRPGLEELLTTTSRPAPARDLAAFGGTVLWGASAYVLAAVAVIVLAAQRATWGSPYVSVILVGLLVLVALGALGYAAGSFFRSRFTAPLTSIVLFAGLFFGGYAGQLLPQLPVLGRVEHLAAYDPHGHLYRVFQGIHPNYSALQALWLVGLAGTALAAVAVKGHRRPLAGGVLVAAVLIAATGASLLFAQPSRDEVSYSRAGDHEVLVPYEPVCEQAGALPVCVHPAYAAFLPDVVSEVALVTGPLAGVLDDALRVEHREQGAPEGTIDIQLLGGRTYPAVLVARRVADSLVNARFYFPEEDQDGGASRVVADWLVAQAGFSITTSEGRFFLSHGPGEAEALERFIALGDGVRQAWLEANYTDLRAGELTLEDLP